MTLPDELNEDGVELLRAAVVQMACRDYADLLLHGRVSRGGGGSGETYVNLRFLEWFFRSKWFTLWSDSDGIYLMNKIRSMCNV